MTDAVNKNLKLKAEVSKQWDTEDIPYSFALQISHMPKIRWKFYKYIG